MPRTVEDDATGHEELGREPPGGPARRSCAAMSSGDCLAPELQVHPDEQRRDPAEQTSDRGVAVCGRRRPRLTRERSRAPRDARARRHGAGASSWKRAERQAGDAGDEEEDHGQYLTETIRLRIREPIAIEVRQIPMTTWPLEVV